jgi:hypothetical protein
VTKIEVPALTVAVAVGVAVLVAVAVAVGVPPIVVAVAVAVAVRIGVGGVPFAAPLNLTESLALPLVALLVTDIESRKVPAAPGAKSTVTESDPFG